MMNNREILENLKSTDAEIETLSSTILNELTHFINLLQKLLKLMRMRWAEKERIMAAISRLESSLHRSILWDYYINNASVISIARKNHYSESYIYELLKKAEARLKL